jgi:GNAT superfamily N-acetyltransferase
VSPALVPFQTCHVASATGLLADAFVDDRGMLTICGHRSPWRTRRSLSAWFRATVHAALTAGQPGWVVIEDDQLAGIALASVPDTPWPIHAWSRWLTTVGGQCGWSAIWHTMRHDWARAAYRPHHAHVVLEFLAVRADRRGRGYGALLVEAVHRWCDAQPRRRGVWLETTRPERVPWFMKYGYRLCGRLPLAPGAEAYCMYRTVA